MAQMMVAVLECQSCGKVLRELAPEEAQKVADAPYNYVVYCPPCGREEYLDAMSRW
jgi:uncharacterized protein with PIN domain